MTLRYATLAPSHKIKALDVLEKTINGKYHDFITLDGIAVTASGENH